MKSQSVKKSFPNEKTMKRIRDRLSDPAYEGGDLAIPANASKSDILHGKIESFTLDRLVGYVEKIFPSFRIKILAA